MAGTILRNSANIHDQDTGELVGYVNPVTGATAGLSATALQALVSPDGNGSPWLDRRPLLAAFGDSINQYEHSFDPITSLTYDPVTGLVTAVMASTTIRVGDVFGVANVTSDIGGYEGHYLTCLSYTAPGTITYRPYRTPTVLSATGGSALMYWRSRNTAILGWANFFSGQRCDIANFGQGGDRISRVRSRFSTDLAQLKATHPDRRVHAFVICIGTNDIYGDDALVADMVTDLTALYELIRAENAEMWFIVPPPQGAGRSFPVSRAASLAKWFDWRTKTRDFCRERVGCKWFDLPSATANGTTVINATDANGSPNTGMVSSDDIHQTNNSARAAGRQIAEVINKLPLPPSELPISTADAGNLVSGLFQGSGGVKTGINAASVVATGWTVSINAGSATDVTATTVARTVAADGDTIGNNQRIQVTGASSGCVVRLRSSTFKTSVALGDEFLGALTQAIASQSGVVSVVPFMAITSHDGATHTRQASEFEYVSASGYAQTEAYSGTTRLRTKARTGYGEVNQASGDARLGIDITFDTSGTGAIDIAIGRAMVRKVA